VGLEVVEGLQTAQAGTERGQHVPRAGSCAVRVGAAPHASVVAVSQNARQQRVRHRQVTGPTPHGQCLKLHARLGPGEGLYACVV